MTIALTFENFCQLLLALRLRMVAGEEEGEVEEVPEEERVKDEGEKY
jgi:hypothetical protein